MSSYQHYLIANFSTGEDESRQPWLIPNDAQEETLDGYVYRGVWQKRDGYIYFATGQKDGAPYCESRIVHRLANVAMDGAIDSSNHTYTLTATTPVRRGSFAVTGNTPAQIVTDNGLGAFTGDGTGTINYSTGAVRIVFNAAPTGGTVLATYDYHPGFPVMMVASYYTATNTQQLIVCDTHFVNKYNPVTNRLDDISPGSPYTGTSFDFFSWVNYPDPSDAPRLLFSNNVDKIQSYDGTTVTDYSFTPPFGITTMKCLLMFSIKDRLVLLNTTEESVPRPLRIRISGTGAFSDNFDDTAAVGAGFIDLPDYGAIQGATLNRDDLIIFTNGSTWILKYTSDDTKPFVPERIDPSRGSSVPFAAITYLNQSTTLSKVGFIGTDGYRVERIDDKIPDYSYDKIDQNNIKLCFAGVVDSDRDHYFIHPSPDQAESDRILVRNYEEFSYSVYKIPLSCMGSFISSFDVTWNDLTIFENWDQMAAQYDSWAAFSYMKGDVISIAGGHHGEIWEIGGEEGEDNQLKVRGTSVSSGITTVTTDFNNFQAGDYIYFESLGGSTELNNKQFPIVSISDSYNFTISATCSAYTSGGTATRVIPFRTTTKKFNPFSNEAAKVRCGWVYFYVSASGTFLTDDNGAPVPAKIDVDVIVNDVEEPIQVEDASGVAYSAPFQVNCSPSNSDLGAKKWYKLFINQTGRFIQFRLKSTQAGAKIKIHAIMPAFAPVGRLI